jgi:uncharacterized protein (TIGR02284 family)
MDNAKLCDELNDLIALDLDAIESYDAAIRRLSVPAIKNRLVEFRGDHQRHVHVLTELVGRLGGVARKKPDVKGFFLKGFTAITAMMGDESALRAMQGNEKLTNRTYHKALEHPFWTDEIRTVLQANWADERRHLEFIEECLRDTSWRSTGRASHP